MDWSQLLPSQVQSDYAEIKQDAQDVSTYAKSYMAAQFTLQLISTAAIVGTFLLMYYAAEKRRSS